MPFGALSVYICIFLCHKTCQRELPFIFFLRILKSHSHSLYIFFCPNIFLNLEILLLLLSIMTICVHFKFYFQTQNGFFNPHYHNYFLSYDAKPKQFSFSTFHLEIVCLTSMGSRHTQFHRCASM